MKRASVFRVIVSAASVCLALLCLEIAFRTYQGKLLHFESVFAPSGNSVSRMLYDSRLGWIPRPGRFELAWISNVDASSLRSNGRSMSTAGRPILAVGDSFTFGDDAEDSETWTARLEGILNTRVLNAGVGAYGIDQAFLRAELLLDRYQPDVVILSFISDDINRTEHSYYSYGQGWKPYFEYANGALNLRNVPVPRTPAPRRFRPLRQALSYSLLADAVLRRLAAPWWRNALIQRVHNDGDTVSLELLARLDRLTKSRGCQFIAVALAANGRIGNNARLPSLVKRAREQGVQVLDLSTDTLKIPPDQLESLFSSSGHYSPAMNGWVAERIAGFLREGERASPSLPPVGER